MVAADLTRQDRDWGLRGEVFIATVEALGRIVAAPRDALTTASVVGRTLIAMNDCSNGTVVLLSAVLAALEAEAVDVAEQLVQEALDVASPSGLVTTGPAHRHPRRAS